MYSKIKIFAFVIVTALLVGGLFPISLLAADDEVVITAPEVTAYRGGTVDVVLNVKQNPGFATLLINIADHQGIEPATEVKNDEEVKIVKNGTVLPNMTVGNDVFGILWDGIKNSTVTGTMCTITFEIADDAKLGKNEIGITVKECFGYDEATDTMPEVSVNISNIVINVEERPADESTSTETTPTETTPTETTPTETAPASPEESTAANNESNSKVETEGNATVNTEGTEQGVNDATGGGCISGCSGAIVAAPILVACLVGGAFIFKKKR